MNTQEMQRRFYVLRELLERWMSGYGQGCENADEDGNPPADCPCLWCETERALDGQA